MAIFAASQVLKQSAFCNIDTVDCTKNNPPKRPISHAQLIVYYWSDLTAPSKIPSYLHQPPSLEQPVRRGMDIPYCPVTPKKKKKKVENRFGVVCVSHLSASSLS